MKKSSTTSLFICAVLVLVTASSCYYPGYTDPYIVDVSRQKENYYYTPAVATTPMLVSKNDFSMILNGVLADNANGGSVHAAFMPSKNIGLMTSYSWLKNDQGSDDVGRFLNYEAGAGYIGKLSSYWHFETYGGMNGGKVENTHHTGYSKIKTNGFFLQPTIFVSNKDQRVQFGFISRFNLAKFNLADTSFNNDREPIVTQQMLLIHDNPSQLFWEPGFVFRAGWKNFQLNAAYSFSNDLSNKEIFRKKDLFTLGVVVRLNASNIETKKKN